MPTTQGAKDILAKWAKCILPAWLCSFVCCVLSGGMLMLLAYVPGILFGQESWWSVKVTDPVSYNPFAGFFALLLVLCCIAAAGYVSYLFNRRYTLGRVLENEYDEGTINKMTGLYAALTAPYLMLIPSMWLWS